METLEETVIVPPTMRPGVLIGTSKTTTLFSPQYSYLLIPKNDGYDIIWRQRKMARKNLPPTQTGAIPLIDALTKQLKIR